MTDMKLPHAMADLRSALGEIVRMGLQSAPDFSALLSSNHGLTIVVDNREEHVSERPPAAGTVLWRDRVFARRWRRAKDRSPACGSGAGRERRDR